MRWFLMRAHHLCLSCTNFGVASLSNFMGNRDNKSTPMGVSPSAKNLVTVFKIKVVTRRARTFGHLRRHTTERKKRLTLNTAIREMQHRSSDRLRCASTTTRVVGNNLKSSWDMYTDLCADALVGKGDSSSTDAKFAYVAGRNNIFIMGEIGYQGSVKEKKSHQSGAGGGGGCDEATEDKMSSLDSTSLKTPNETNGADIDFLDIMRYTGSHKNSNNNNNKLNVLEHKFVAALENCDNSKTSLNVAQELNLASSKMNKDYDFSSEQKHINHLTLLKKCFRVIRYRNINDNTRMASKIKSCIRIDRRTDAGADITFDDLASKNKNTNLRRFMNRSDASVGFEKRGVSSLANPVVSMRWFLMRAHHLCLSCTNFGVASLSNFMGNRDNKSTPMGVSPSAKNLVTVFKIKVVTRRARTFGHLRRHTTERKKRLTLNTAIREMQHRSSDRLRCASTTTRVVGNNLKSSWDMYTDLCADALVGKGDSSSTDAKFAYVAGRNNIFIMGEIGYQGSVKEKKSHQSGAGGGGGWYDEDNEWLIDENRHLLTPRRTSAGEAAANAANASTCPTIFAIHAFSHSNYWQGIIKGSEDTI
ncbi:hypothetical protein O3P69_014194 [Scylla paramamosain]|uniref:Uncharacterized protein n=1 Tax=Scylla paramamosain TaxID=85552 RepID=A0AAW0SA36_SCYPA